MEQVQTGVDSLMQLVKKETKISLKEAANKLSVPETTVQAWVDFLVEDHILGIEYKFTTPYIYVHDEKRLDEVQHTSNQQYSLKDYKNGFITKARNKDIPEERIEPLWREHLQHIIKQQKNFFLRECERRGVSNSEKLYEQYMEKITHAA